ncbi:hypothetical protein [Pararhodobacter oceanensis]|uniref:Glycosyltransferase RgtA/B/C/D-like domain-containing protein n=1 Tax=Pararhodobacter oceanensis TaxID=2172121 RepID=A0A2T8HXF5_9RHOB|nr:hypothetical protein [Pararhodobacter oceanensis]PVH30084.1 hypothetical protein DDE20_00470 [Pararhodobacter oceanensis]
MRAVAFILYASLVTLLPVLVVAWNHGALTPFWFLAGDAYLYLGIGQSSSGLTMSFDGLRPTNGFHPLWQVFVRAATALSATPLQAIAATAYGAIAFTLGGVLLLGFAIRRFTGSWLLAMLAVPGVYYLTIGQALRNLPVWGFFSGMEAGLAFFIAALLAYLTSGLNARRRNPTWLTIGIILAFLVLTRLDELFIPACMAVTVALWPSRPYAERITAGALISLPTAIGLALFVGWSLWTTGMLAPVSGAAKGSGALVANAWVTLATFFAPMIELREGLTNYTADRAGLAGGAFRVVELIIPAAFAVGFLVHILRRNAQALWAPILAGICGGIVIKTIYNIGAVNYWHQAPWYFAVAMLMMTLGAAIMLAPAVRRLRRGGRVIATLVLATVTLLHASLWSSDLMTDRLRPAQRDFWLDRSDLQDRLIAADPEIRLLEFGDGMLNFTFDFPVRHGFVFAGDAQSLEALRAGRLLRESHAEGFEVLSSYEYLRVPEGAESWTSEDIRTFLLASFLAEDVKDELRHFTFEMLTVHRPSGVPFIRLIPRG